MTIETKKVASANEAIEIINRLNYRHDTFCYTSSTFSNKYTVEYRHFDAYRQNGETDRFAIIEIVVNGKLEVVRFFNLFRDITVDLKLGDFNPDYSRYDEVINVENESATENEPKTVEVENESAKENDSKMTIGTKIATNNSTVDTANNTVISMTQYKDLLAWAEKVSNGQLDAATQIKTHCATWLNADIDKNTVIDIIKADDLNGFRNFLAQFNFTVKDDAGYIHKLYTYENGDCVLAEIPSSEYSKYSTDAKAETATTNTEVKEPDDEDREKFLRAKEEIQTTAGRYLGDGKFAQIWQRNNGFGWRNIAKKNAALILAEYGLTVDEYLAAKKQWVAEGVARGAAQCAIYYQAQFLRDKIERDCKPVDDDNDVFNLVPNVDELNDTRSDIEKEFDEYAGEDCDLNDRYNRGEKIAADLTAKLSAFDPTVEITFEIDYEYDEDGKDTFYLRFDGIHGAYCTASNAESIFHDLKRDIAEVAKDATADSLTRAMKIALEHYQDFCRAKNLTGAEYELSLYNICRKAMSELWKEEAA